MTQFTNFMDLKKKTCTQLKLDFLVTSIQWENAANL